MARVAVAPTLRFAPRQVKALDIPPHSSLHGLMAKRATSFPVVPVILVLVAAVAAGLTVQHYFADRAAKVVATQEARARFPAIRAAIAKRLNQPHPIELGAVWAMHSGRICGLVNGEGSFSGLTGMTPFYADGTRVTFALDSDPDVFAGPWVDCNQDMWVVVLGGSTEEGICGVKAHADRCHYTDKRQLVD